MRKRLLIILGIIAVLVVVVLAAFPRLRQRLLTGQAQASNNTVQTVTAQRGDLTAYVGATGSLRSNQTALLSWQTSGQIATVAVTKGQQVKKGDIMASLAQTSLSAAMINAAADLVAAQSNLQTVLDNSKPRADAELALSQAQKALDDAQKATQSKLFQNASPNSIDIARANVITAQTEVDKWTEIYNRNAARSNDDAQYAAALSGLANARQNLDRAQYNLQYAVSLPNPLDVQTVYAQLDQAKANLLTAKQNWDKVKNGPNPDDILAAQAKVAAAQASLDAAQISAPFSGTVTAVTAMVGDRVVMGTNAIQVDDLSRLLVDVQVSEVDINRVQRNQPVDLTFDAIPNKTYTGSVTDIASVGVASGGTVNFDVSVEVNAPDTQIKPGMTASANIAVTQLKGVLLVPSRAIRVINNRRVVYVLRNGSQSAVDVTLGASDNTYTQIVSGDLHEGDKVVLNPSTSSTIGGNGGGFRIFGGDGGGNTNSASPSSGSNTNGSNTKGSNPNSGGSSGGANGGQ